MWGRVNVPMGGNAFAPNNGHLTHTSYISFAVERVPSILNLYLNSNRMTEQQMRRPNKQTRRPHCTGSPEIPRGKKRND